MKFSVVILGHPSANRLLNAIKSASQWSDDVVVIYDGEIAPTHLPIETTVVVNPLISFAQQRNLGNTYCTNEWILHLDSDEEISDELGNYLLNYEGTATGLAVSCRTYIWGKEARHSFGKDYHVRIQRQSIDWIGSVHEVLAVSGSQIQKIPPKYFLRHYTIDSLNQWIRKTMVYIQYESSHGTGKRHKIRGPLRPIYRASKVYFLNGGVLDGEVGIVVMALTLVYETLLLIALWEMKRGHTS